ncbi:MAG: TIM barrel protein, partial [Gemmatimonadales bacterium]|nr:TIM barrel protein [Gemmatimonadales bacterium]
ETRPRLKEIEGWLRDSGIGVSALLTGEELDLDGIKKALDWTARLQAFAFVLHLSKIRPDERERIEEFVQTYTPAAEYAEQLGVSLAVQSCYLDSESWDVMFGAVPKLTLKYDPSFSAQAGRDYRAEILKYRTRIAHAHAKDEICVGRDTDYANGIVRYQYVPAGMGDIHWGSVIALLLEGGYEGDIAIETHSDFWLEHLEWDLALGKRHLEQFIPAEAGEGGGQLGKRYLEQYGPQQSTSQ